MEHTNQVKYKGCLIFQPGLDKPCPVDMVYSYMHTIHIPNYFHVCIDGSNSFFSDEFDLKAPVTELPERIIYISHGAKKNFTFDSNNGYKNALWFNSKADNSFVIAHSCYSAYVLSHPDWNAKFRNWIGSADKLWYNDDPASAKVWSYFFIKLCEQFIDIQSGAEGIDTLKKLYLSAILESRIEPADAIIYYTFAKRNSKHLIYK